MKRREFLVKSAALTGSLIPVATLASQPCPPYVEGGSGFPCGGADADWAFRSTGPGVVWAHDFSSPLEVDAFRWTGGVGNDPNDVRGDTTCVHVATDGITGGGCLEIGIPTGGKARGGWWRPFSAINGAGNGKGSDDPGAGGSIAPKSWDYNNAGQNEAWFNGYYGHQSYHENSVLKPSTPASSWDGTDFYIQFRVKIQASRWANGNPDGKLAFISTTRRSNPQQELIVQSQNGAYWAPGGTNIYRMYTSNGNQFNSFLTDPQGGNSGASMQPNGPFDGTCRIGDNPATCWMWPVEEWVTVLLHVVPGRQRASNSLSDPSNPKDAGLQVWVARVGETAYTKIWDKMDYQWFFGGDDGSHPEAFNAFQPSGYMNNVAAAVGWYQRFDQIIFSKQFIPCPQV